MVTNHLLTGMILQVGSLSRYLRRVLYIPGGAGFLNHQQDYTTR